MRVLIVEDEEHLARLVAAVLGREGYAAEIAFDGRTALARAMTEDFDLLVLDWMLPDLDGVQVVKRLRAADVGVSVLMREGYAGRPPPKTEGRPLPHRVRRYDPEGPRWTPRHQRLRGKIQGATGQDPAPRHSSSIAATSSSIAGGK